MAKITTLTTEQRARFSDFVAKWTAIGLSTQPADRERSETAIANLYRLAKLKEPRVIWLPCPLSAALATVVYARLRNVGDQKEAVRSAVGSAVDSAVYSAVDSAVDSAVGSAVDSAVGSAVDSAVRSAVRSAVDSAVRSAVGSAVDSAVRSAVRSAVGSAVDSAVRSAVDSAVGSAQSERISETVAAAMRETGLAYFGGGLWSAYAAWADYFNAVLAVSIDRNYLDLCESCGYYWTLDDVCFASERPADIHLDTPGRLHNDTGMSIRYPSGWGLYHLGGVAVPADIIESPHTLTVARIEAEANTEVRRVMISQFGTARYIQESGAALVHSLPDNYYVRGLQNARLFRKPRQNDTDIVMVAVKNSTPEPDGSVKDYFLRIEPGAYDGLASRDCHAAVASTWRNADGSLAFKRPQDYAPRFES